MVRRWCIPLAGAVLVVGSVAASAPAAAAGTAPHASAVRQVRPGGRMISPGSPLTGRSSPQHASQSTNWSGYAATGSFHSVSANWTEPTGRCTSATRYASFWVGLDGLNSSTVEQTGSEVDCSGGSPVYYSWYEMYPAFPHNFSNSAANGSPIGNFAPTRIVMVDNSGRPKDSVSSLTGGGSFSATWLRAN